MKTIRVRISDDSVASDTTRNLEYQLQGKMRQAPEFEMIFKEMESCIREFTGKAKALSKSGTTIYAERTFSFPNADVLITLEHPKKRSVIDRLKRLFNKG